MNGMAAVALALLANLPADAGNPPGWKAGVATAVITPKKPLWLAGYAGRDHPAEGTLHDVWIKALALEDADGRRAVLLTSDLCGIPQWLDDHVCARLAKSHGLTRDRIRLTCSHNHCAPVVRGDLEDYYPLDAAQKRLVDDYSDWLEGQMVATLGRALDGLKPARLSAGEGRCTFAVNRRNNKEAEVQEMLRRGETPRGPVDHGVPVLAVRAADGRLLAVVFAYACHNTVLSFYQYCGDYAGFAQIALEKEYPGAVALFVAGCGGDQNPLPRRRVELAEAYGRRLAASVDGVLAAPMRPLAARMHTAHERVALDFDRNPTRQELQGYLKDSNPVRARWARRVLAQLDAGRPLARSRPYAVQAWRLGDQLWIALGGEALVDYALKFKRTYGPGTWVTSYYADLTAYIPSERNWREGGYEVAYLYEYMLPADRWARDVEDRITAAVDRLVNNVSP